MILGGGGSGGRCDIMAPCLHAEHDLETRERAPSVLLRAVAFLDVLERETRHSNLLIHVYWVG